MDVGGGGRRSALSAVLVKLIATCGGVGYFPYAPGTVGSVLGVVLYVGLGRLSITVYGLILALGLGLGIWVSGRAERLLGSRDCPAIVIDEVVGYLVTMALVPRRVELAVLGFLLFRGLDIWKPFTGVVERLPSGWGVMLDDLVAGVGANLILQLLGRVVWT